MEIIDILRAFLQLHPTCLKHDPGINDCGECAVCCGKMELEYLVASEENEKKTGMCRSCGRYRCGP